jgi:hypothetical protein
MGAVLDELFTERPLALLIMTFDFSVIIALLFLLINATWSVQHEGPLHFGEILVIITLLFFNFVYVIREYINFKSASKLTFKLRFNKVLDTFNVLTVFAVVGMSFSSVSTTPSTFINTCNLVTLPPPSPYRPCVYFYFILKQQKKCFFGEMYVLCEIPF